ncbi:hypothetical protein PFISCL1PPCAC_28930, partial [Pristionchus fissidentatus]
RFNFLNGSDCPDWLQAEIVQISNMTNIKYKLMCGLVLNSLIKRQIDHIDISKFVNETLDRDSVRRILVATSYIMENCAISSTSYLTVELEQLGMPSEHARVLSRAIESSSDLIPSLLPTIAK